MAITTLDGLLAGLQRPENFWKFTGTYEGAGIMHSLLLCAGMPGAGTAPSSGMAGQAITSLPGMPSFSNPAGGQKAYLSRFAAESSFAGKIYLMDRLWQNSGISPTTTTAQTVDSVAFPARDDDGSTNGRGVLVGLECYTATTNGGAISTSTITYTNSEGATGHTGAFAAALTGAIWPATATVGTFVPFMLAAGDKGIRSVQSITLGTTYSGGAIGLVAFRQLASMEFLISNVGMMLDWSQLGLPELHADTSFWLVFKSLGSTIATTWGQLQIAHG